MESRYGRSRRCWVVLKMEEVGRGARDLGSRVDGAIWDVRREHARSREQERWPGQEDYKERCAECRGGVKLWYWDWHAPPKRWGGGRAGRKDMLLRAWPLALLSGRVVGVNDKVGRDGAAREEEAPLPDVWGLMSSSAHPITILSYSNVEDAFSSTTTPGYTPALPNYFLVSPRNTSLDPLDYLSKYLLASLAISPFHDDPYMKDM
ncbi:hypothetical protein Tco_1021893 [Tanacetum coccineum]